jgi:hypothetical protein
MVADPCNAQLESGLFGDEEGMLARFKTSESTDSKVDSTSGFVLWCPEFCCHESSVNGFGFVTSDANQGPNNDGANPAFSGAAWTGNVTPALNPGFALRDPVAQFMSNDLAQDSRCLSACLQMTYSGAMQDSRGQFCRISNFPLEAILSGNDSNTPVTVNQLFQYSSRVERLGIDTVDVVHRGQERNSATFRSEEDDCLDVGNGAPSSVPQTTALLGLKVYGFAWRNVNSQAELNFMLTKNIEWRASPSSGLTQTTVRSNGQSLLPIVTASLDRVKSDWTSGLGANLQSIASSVAKTAFTGVSRALRSDAFGTILKGATAAAPLLLL